MTAAVMTPIELILSRVTASLDFHNEFNWWQVLAGKVSHDHFDWLCDEIRTNGFTIPIVIVKHDDENWSTGNGHHRLCAAILLGLEEVPVIFTDGDYWRFEDSHDGDVELSSPSFDYWQMLKGNMQQQFPGDEHNGVYRAQYNGDNYDGDNGMIHCDDCGENYGEWDCHDCPNVRCGECEYVEDECCCAMVTPQQLADDEYRYIRCQDCGGWGYALHHAACAIPQHWEMAIAENAARHIPAWHPEYILADAYQEHAEWLRDEPLRQAHKEWQNACDRLRLAVSEGVSDTMLNILARNVAGRFDAWQAL